MSAVPGGTAAAVLLATADHYEADQFNVMYWLHVCAGQNRDVVNVASQAFINATGVTLAKYNSGHTTSATVAKLREVAKGLAT